MKRRAGRKKHREEGGGDEGEGKKLRAEKLRAAFVVCAWLQHTLAYALFFLAPARPLPFAVAALATVFCLFCSV